VGYKFTRVASARTTVRFSVSFVADLNINIPKYTVLATDFVSDNFYFVTLEDCWIAEGESSVEVYAMEGVKRIQAVTYEQLNASAIVDVASKRVAEDSVRVIVDGMEWEEVDDVYVLLDSGKYFSCYEDSDDNFKVAFIPTWKNEGINEASEIEIQYVISSGGNVSLQVGTVKKVLDAIYNSEHEVVEVSVTNTERVSGGAEPESIEVARVKAPNEVKTMWTAVTLEDFKVLAESVPGVAKAAAIDWTVPGGYVEIPYYIDIFIVPYGGGAPSDSLKENVYNYLMERRSVTVSIAILDPMYISIDVNVRVYIERGTIDLISLKERVIESIEDYFNEVNQSFGNPLRFSRFISMIQNVDPRIVYVRLITPDEDILSEPVQFPVLGTLSVVVEEIL